MSSLEAAKNNCVFNRVNVQLLIELNNKRDEICIRKCTYSDFVDELDFNGDLFIAEMALREIANNLPFSGYEGEAHLLNRAIALAYKINMQAREGVSGHKMTECELEDWHMFFCACEEERNNRRDTRLS